MNRLLQFAHDDRGQDLIEYSLLITFIAIASIIMIAEGHPIIDGVWHTANADITAANTVASGR
jgi:Flp pilus assembly pilin Flp